LEIKLEQIQTSPNLNKHLWVKLIASLAGLLFISQLIEQALNQQMKQAMQSESSGFVITAFALFINGVSIIWLQTIVVMFLFQDQHPETKSFSVATKIQDFTKEWLRAMGVTSLWMFALVIPGLIRWIDYTLLPFVCFFDTAYQEGAVDALDRCRTLARGIRGRLWCLMIGFSIVIPLIITGVFGDFESLFEHPIAATLLVIFDAVVQALAFWLVWRLYLKTRPLS
jgi:hypothetical protein